MPTLFRTNPPFSAEAITTRSASPIAVTTAASTASSTLAGSTVSTATSAPSAAGTLPAAVSFGGSAVGVRTAGTFSTVGINAQDAGRVVEIGQEPAQPIFVRAGKEVLAPAFNPKAVDDFLGHTVPIGHTKVPVTVSQSIPAGTRVARGTPVDLVLATVADIPFQLFDQFHADLATKTVADLLPLATDPAISPLLDKDEATLTADQKAVITNALAAQNVHIVETDATRNFSTALQSLRDVQAFA